MLTDKGIIKRYGPKLYDKENALPPKGYSHPRDYGMITNETDNPILIPPTTDKFQPSASEVRDNKTKNQEPKELSNPTQESGRSTRTRRKK